MIAVSNRATGIFLTLVLLGRTAVSSSFTPIPAAIDQQQKRLQPQFLCDTSSSCPPRRVLRRRMTASASEPDNGDPSSSFANMDSLSERMRRQETQYAKLLLEQSKYADGGREIPESVHIILFHPDTVEQSAHTIEYPKGSGNNIILAFESGAECVRFAGMLKELQFVNPSVSSFLYLLFGVPLLPKLISNI